MPPIPARLQDVIDRLRDWAAERRDTDQDDRTDDPERPNIDASADEWARGDALASLDTDVHGDLTGQKVVAVAGQGAYRLALPGQATVARTIDPPTVHYYIFDGGRVESWAASGSVSMRVESVRSADALTDQALRGHGDDYAVSDADLPSDETGPEK